MFLQFGLDELLFSLCRFARCMPASVIWQLVWSTNCLFVSLSEVRYSRFIYPDFQNESVGERL